MENKIYWLKKIVRPTGKYFKTVIVKCGEDGRGRAPVTPSLSLSLWDERFQEQLVVTLLPPLILGTRYTATSRAPALQNKQNISARNKCNFLNLFSPP